MMQVDVPRFLRGYSIAALLVLAGGIALDASFLTRFQQQYPYGAPVGAGDLAVLLRGFTPADLLIFAWSLPVIALAVLTVLAIWFRSRIAASIRLALSFFQLPVTVVGGVGAAVFLSTLGVWAPVPAIVFTASLNDLIGSRNAIARSQCPR